MKLSTVTAALQMLIGNHMSPLKKQDAQVIDLQIDDQILFLPSLPRLRGGWSANHAPVGSLTVLMKHFAMVIKVPSLMAIIMLAGGCDRIKDSGIPKTLKTDVLLRTAGKGQDITFGATGSGEGRRAYAVDSHSDFTITISSGTPGQLLAAFRGEVKHQIESMGAKIHETGVSGNEADVRAFSYGYSWSDNEGIVRVHSFVGTNGQIEITLFCYEHRR
jgi:hypothetical protein